LQAGVIIADISVPNPNVFFEIGLASGLGKDPLLLKRKDTPLPADFGGARYLEYDIDDLAKGRDLLKRQLIEWANIRGMGGVKEVVDANHRGRPNR
jgi:predicted nucleotide-binding protein